MLCSSTLITGENNLCTNETFFYITTLTTQRRKYLKGRMTDKQKQEEFLKLLEPVRDKLSRFIRALSRNREEARDIVGESILRAYENFGKLKNKDSFSSYIFRIAVRLHKRTGWRKRLFSEYDEEFALEIPAKDISAETNVDIQFLYNTMLLLPDKQRQALILFEISGFSIKEIRDIQGGSISGVKIRLKRAREKLVEIMKKDINIIKQNPDLFIGRPVNLSDDDNGAVINYSKQNVTNL